MSSKSISAVGELAGFEFRTANLYLTEHFYEELGFIKEYDVDTDTNPAIGFRSVYFRDQRYEGDVVDNETVFFVFTYDKSKAEIQCNGNAIPTRDTFKVVVHVRDMTSAIQHIERMEEHCGCWIQENPLRVTENILTAVAVDPNGLRLQLVQLSGTGLYEDEDETKKGGRALPERIFNRNWEVKFGDLHIQHSRPAALATLIERIFSSQIDDAKSEGGRSSSQGSENGNNAPPVRNGLRITDREEYPTAMAELIWVGSVSRLKAPCLCLYSREQRSTQFTSLAAVGDGLESTTAVNDLFLGTLFCVQDLDMVQKLSDIHANSNSIHGDLGRFDIQQEKYTKQLQLSYLPVDDIDTRFKVFTREQFEFPLEKRDEDSKEVRFE
jgi:hypothetical protein|eukprot:g4503.t1